MERSTTDFARVFSRHLGRWGHSLICGVAVLTASSAYAQVPDMFEDFDGGGTTPYALANSSGAAPGVLAGGPSRNFLRLSDGSGASSNSIAFDEDPAITGPRPDGKIFSIDFSLSVDGSSPEVAGLGFGYAAVGPWGASGAMNPGAEDPLHDWNQPAFNAAVMVGLDVSPDGNFVNLNAFGNTLDTVDVQPILDLTSGLFHRASLTVTPDPADATKALFDLEIIEDVHGAAIPHSIMSSVPANVNLGGLPGNRVIVGATAGNVALTADIDNVGVTIIPEPSSTLLIALGTLVLAPFVRRRRHGE